MIERLPISANQRVISVFTFWQKEGYLDLNPPYQRGDVWGIERRRNLIKSLLLGVPIPSVVINDRFSSNFNSENDNVGQSIVVIDGKQRITTFLMFLNGELSIPREWVENSKLKDSINFCDIPKNIQSHIKCIPIGVCEASLKTLDQEKEVFDLINYGGVEQGKSD